MAPSDIPTVASKLYELLEPIEPLLRKRAIKAALTMLGDDDVDPRVENRRAKQNEVEDDAAEGNDLPRKVQVWMKSYSVSDDHLQPNFHIENGKVELIASGSPGKNGKERTINAYILTGLTKFLETEEAKFDDKSARATCKALGCLDDSNHAYNLKGKGNLIGGTKDSGWTLTGPGLKAGAELLKSMAGT
jgi:hypothetical protein